MHITLDRRGLFPGLIGIARATGVSAYVADSANRWPAVHTLDAARLYRLALENAPAGSRLHAVAEDGVLFLEIAGVIAGKLGVAAVSIAPGDPGGHFSYLAPFVALDNPVSSERTRQLLGWQPAQVALIEDLGQSHYFQQERRTSWHSPCPDMTGKMAIVTGANSGVRLATARGSCSPCAASTRLRRRQCHAQHDRGSPAGPRQPRFRAILRRRLGRPRRPPGQQCRAVSAGAAAHRRRIRAAGRHQPPGPLRPDQPAPAAHHGRVVTVSSQAERLGRIDFDDPNFEHRGYQGSRAYNQSKLANLLFTAELQRRLKAVGSNVLAQAAHPGFVATEIYDGTGGAVKLMVRLLAQGPDQGALPVLYAAVADIPGNSFAGPSHFAHMRGAPELIKRSAAARDPDLAQRLWQLSERLTATRFPLAESTRH